MQPVTISSMAAVRASIDWGVSDFRANLAQLAAARDVIICGFKANLQV